MDYEGIYTDNDWLEGHNKVPTAPPPVKFRNNIFLCTWVGRDSEAYVTRTHPQSHLSLQNLYRCR